jgi:hypothetical protein
MPRMNLFGGSKFQVASTCRELLKTLSMFGWIFLMGCTILSIQPKLRNEIAPSMSTGVSQDWRLMIGLAKLESFIKLCDV